MATHCIRPLSMTEAVATATAYRTWMCVVCGFIYDEADGLPEEGIARGNALGRHARDLDLPGLRRDQGRLRDDGGVTRFAACRLSAYAGAAQADRQFGFAGPLLSSTSARAAIRCRQLRDSVAGSAPGPARAPLAIAHLQIGQAAVAQRLGRCPATVCSSRSAQRARPLPVVALGIDAVQVAQHAHQDHAVRRRMQDLRSAACRPALRRPGAVERVRLQFLGAERPARVERIHHQDAVVHRQAHQEMAGEGHAVQRHAEAGARLRSAPPPARSDCRSLRSKTSFK